MGVAEETELGPDCCRSCVRAWFCIRSCCCICKRMNKKMRYRVKEKVFNVNNVHCQDCLTCMF